MNQTFSEGTLLYISKSPAHQQASSLVETPKSKNIIYNYLTKGHTKFQLRNTPDLRNIPVSQVKRKLKDPKDIVRENITADIDEEANIVRHRTNLVKSRINHDITRQRLKFLRPPSEMFDPPLNTTTIEGQNSMDDLQKELYVSIGTIEPESLFKMPTDLKELKIQIKPGDLLLNLEESIDALEVMGDEEIPKEFILNGISKKSYKNTLPKLGGPSSRKDVELLGEWLDTMLRKIYEDKNQNPAEMFENTQIVYTICLKELIRQVSMHCIQRGELIERVWKVYFSLMLKAIRIYQTSKIQYHNKSLNAIKSSQKKFIQKNNDLTGQLQFLHNELDEAKKEIEDQRKIIEKMTFKEKKYKNRIKILQAQYEKNKVRLLRLEDTNKNLNYLIDQVLEDLETEAPGIKKVQYKNKIRFRELSKLILSDPLLQALGEIKEEEVGKTTTDEIELENKVFMQELQDRMEETAEEMKDIAVDTSDFFTFVPKDSQTDYEDFPIPLVDIDKVSQNNHLLKEAEQLLISLNTAEAEDSPAQANDWFQDKIGEDSDEEIDELFDYANKRAEKVIEIDDDFVELLWDETSLEKARELLKNKFISNQGETQQILKSVMTKYMSNHQFTKSLQETMKKLKIKLFQKIKRERQLEEEIKILQNAEDDTDETPKIIRPARKRRSTQLLKAPPPRFMQRATKVKEVVAKKNTEAKEFSLGNKVVLFKKDDLSPATKIFEKIVQGKLKIKVTVTKKSLAKQLSIIIADYRTQSKESTAVRTQDLYLFLYDYFTTKHGLKGVAERKFVQLVMACERHKDNPHINLFARFLGIFDPLTIEDFRFYIEVLEALYGNKLGSDIINDIEEQVPTVKCIDTLYIIFYNRLEENELNNIKLELLSMAKPCPKGIYPAGVIERADFILFLIKKFQDFLALRRNYVEDLFNAADLNGDGYLQFAEFDLVYRNIEYRNYDLASSKEYFESYSDLIAEEGGKNASAISYYRFSILSLEKSLFFIEIQEEFLNVTHEKGIIGHLDQLRGNADFITNQMLWRLKKCNKISDVFEGIINTLNSKLKETDKPRPVYIAFRLMEEETKRLLIQSIASSMLPAVSDLINLSNEALNDKRNKKEEMLSLGSGKSFSKKDYSNKQSERINESDEEWEEDGE
ncbi:unnamed protein product [Blepharisma stoltei]|uniref:EF-hand domain-containing protein n=1 Tax=Blepharisma stoltei TaxID=1481888 RepID=A0AAU9I9Y6_9CILI|nr:unnamed protein product [Blepharisma stoltei]